MNKKIIIPLIAFFAIINLYAACEGDDDEAPDYFVKCKVNGVLKEYSVNQAYYDIENDITVVHASSGMYGEIGMVWKGQKIATGEITVEGMEGENKPHIWLTDYIGALDTFSSITYKYKLSKYDDVGGKIAGEFSAEIKSTKIAYMLDTLILDTIQTADTLIVDSIQTQMLMYRQVPEYLINVSDGKFSLYRGE